MSNKHTLCGLFKDIANVIRENDNTTELIPAIEFPDRLSIILKDLLAEILTNNVTVINAEDIDGLTHIPSYAFAGCSNLQLITLPDSVTSISQHAFYKCPNLKVINVPGDEQSITTIPLNNIMLSMNECDDEEITQQSLWGAENATIVYNYRGE